MLKSKKNSVAMLFGLLVSAFITPVQAHEPRDGVANGAYNISVGNRVEPAYAGEPNAFDLIIRNADDTAADVQEIEIDVVILFLKEDAIDAKVKRKAKLMDDLRRDRSQPNRFNISYLPTKAGAYGYHVKGMIDGNMLDEVFVCRGGSQNPEGRSFSCINKIQKFPNGKKNKSDDDDDD